MANLAPTLMHLLYPIALFLMIGNKANSQTYKTNFTFSSFGSDSSGLTFQGDAYIPPNSSFVRLTAVSDIGLPLESSVGRILYSEPVKLWEDGSAVYFNSTIKFNMTALSGLGYGEGLAFFIAPVGTTIPEASSGGYLGLYNSSGYDTQIFAVEFDTSFEGEDWDPAYEHVGINFKSVKSSSSIMCGLMMREVTAHIYYDGPKAETSLNVSCDSGAGLSHVSISYSMYNIMDVVPQHVQVGIAASTGGFESRAIQDVHYWSFSSSYRSLFDSM